MDKAFEIQRQVRDNAKSYQTYLTDLQNWEIEMKRKEAALNGVYEQVLVIFRLICTCNLWFILCSNLELIIIINCYGSVSRSRIESGHACRFFIGYISGMPNFTLTVPLSTRKSRALKPYVVDLPHAFCTSCVASSFLMRAAKKLYALSVFPYSHNLGLFKVTD